MVSRVCPVLPAQDMFHLGELARMKHAHEIARNSTKRRRSTIDTTGGVSMSLPSLIRKRNVSCGRPCRSDSTRVIFRTKNDVRWEESLRRNVIALPVPRYSHPAPPGGNQDRMRIVYWTQLALPTNDVVVRKDHSTPFDTAFPDKTALDSERSVSLEEIISSGRGRCALETLQRLFLPRWRLYVHLVGLQTKSVASHRTRDLLSSGRRSRVKQIAVAVIISFLSSKRLPILREFYHLKLRVIIIQTAFRRYKKCMDARVELNYRKVRTEVEQQYWVEVEKSYEREMDELLAHKKNALYEMEIPNLRIAGRLPELLLRRELRSALYSQLRRALRSTTRQKPMAFLPLATYYAVLDNVCYVTSVVRGTKTLSEHLRRRPKMIQIY